MTRKTSKAAKAEQPEQDEKAALAEQVAKASAAKVLQQEEEEKAPPPLPDTEATKLWNRIKDLPIELFALPDQTVSMYCRYVPIDPEKMFVLIKSSAVLPALENSLRLVRLEPNQMWDVEQAPPYTVISIRNKLPFSAVSRV